MLSFLAVLKAPIVAIRGWLGGRPRDIDDAEMVARFRASFGPPAPAVAGFVYRLPTPPTDFQLPARLASVARLNTPAGRVPYSRPAAGAKGKMMPKAAASARQRSKPASYPTLQRQSNSVAAAGTASAVVDIASARRRCIPLEVRIKQAA